MGQGVSVQNLISIIVPVYNTEKYIDRCIQSILAQTYTNWELLLIDDGSTDSSGMICDKYAKQDDRIHSFHKSNEGISATRNYGIERITGEYVIHIDSDDWVDTEMLYDMYHSAQESQADMIMCDFIEEYNDNQPARYIVQRPSSTDAPTVLLELFQHLHGSCCNKLIRSKCYKDFNLRYPLQLNMSEDLYVMVALLLNPVKIIYIPKAYYHYVKGANELSLTRSVSLLTLKNRFKKFDLLTQGHLCHSICMTRMSFAIASLAFNDGKMSSKEYAIKMSPYKQWITAKTPYLHGYSIISRLRILIACMGFYRQMYWLYTLKIRSISLLKLIV